jgi:transposase
LGIVGGWGLHRKQITPDVLDTETSQVRRGRISPTDRQLFPSRLTGFAGQHVEMAVEGCTGWRFVIEECHAPGVVGHLAEPADVQAAGPGLHPKTDSNRSAWCRRSRR